MPNLIRKIAGSSITGRVFDLVLILSAVLLVLLPLSPLNMQMVWRDSGVFLYTGWRIDHGQVPYRDLWDQKPPVIFYIDALGLALAGGSRWGVWVLELISLFAAAWIGYQLIRRFLGRTVAVFSLFAWLLNLVFIIHGGNLTTEYTLPLQFACIFLAIHQVGKTKTWYHNGLIGVFCGIAFFTKQNTIGIGLAILLFKLAQGIPLRTFKKVFLDTAWMAIGGLAVTLVVLAAFILQGALRQFWDAAFYFNMIYARMAPLADHFKALQDGVSIFPVAGFSYLSLGGWVIGLVLLAFKKLRPELRPLVAIALLDFPIELVFVSLPGRSYSHYYMTLLPVCSILTALVIWALVSLGNRLKRLASNQILWQGAVTLAVLLAITIAEYKSFYGLVISLRLFRNDPMIAYIEQHTNQNDDVYMWGAETSMNFLTLRVSPSRFNYLTPLYTSDYTDTQKEAEFMGDLETNRPLLIIDTHYGFPPVTDFGSTASQKEAWQRFLQGNYAVVYRIDKGSANYTVYRRK